VIAIDQVLWTANGAMALVLLESGQDPQSMAKFLDFSLLQIDAMVDLVRQPISKQQRTLLGALLTIDVHARDVTRQLLAKDTKSLTDFDWTKQLRYYWDVPLDDVVAKQTNSQFQYGYEYLGNGPRLVITPLTDTCYMTLTGALHMRLGGAPAGPAGTGKTETTKDLAKALAVYCVVFNCSDGLDYKIMGRFFSGLAQQGAWACFDEFNRIDIEVLSVIAQQILCIQQAICKGVTKFDFEGTIIPLNYAFGVFITMNPGYAGRTELPDNLKALFRPVAMMVPDYRLIAEIILFSEGFANALPLSNKMAQLYALSSEQLSKQSHYDFGMRAVKSVLVAAGQLKRKEPETNEDLLLIRAMRDSNVPKFLEQDLPLFGGIIKDLFPGIHVPYVDYGKLQLAVEMALEELNLQKVNTFITKVIQIHETQLVRHGMMVVGETGSGKSTNIRVLAKALGSLHAEGVIDKDGFYKVVDCLILNPKSITAGELYGEFNLMTNEWKDGIVPKLVRDCVNATNEGSDNRKWIIFDGPVDAVWIENMNTVLDDNKTLCLANSERIKLPSTLHMMFEVQDLKVASPATVSRCGMVYMEQIHVGIVSLVLTWGATTLIDLVGKRHSKTIISFIEYHLVPTLDFVREFCLEKVNTTNIQLTSQLINLITSCLQREADPKAICKDKDLVTALIVWSIIWSIGANIADASRVVLQEFLFRRFSVHISVPYAMLLEEPYDHFVDLSRGALRSWADIQHPFNYDPHAPYFNILVPTVDTTRYRYLLDVLMKAGHNVLFMAETGVGKSVVINNFLNEMVAEGKTVSYVVGYSAQTKPQNLRDVLETKLEKKRKNLLGPPSGKKMFLFIDDLNMPSLETYGAQPPNELLRQVMDQGGFYDVQKLFFKYVQDVICVAACAPPGGGRNEVSPRLLRHFHMVWLTNLSEKSMCTIFTSILHGFLLVNGPSVAHISSSIVNSSVNIYLQIQKELLPTPLRSHYTFNLRDLSKIFQGILMISSQFLDTLENVLKLWCHESCRVFRDRLINDEDRTWYNNAVLNQLQTHLSCPHWTVNDFKDLIYGNFLTRTPKVYQEFTDKEKINSLLMEYLEEYNITYPTRMELVFFSDAINHICRISRILSQPRGNALLVGVGGSGRQSLTRMASFIADYKCKQIEITRGYGMNEFHENIKEILMNSGAKNIPTVFLFSDTQIVVETFLEDINNILNSGEVPNLFENDEWEKIINLVRPLIKKAGKIDTRDNIVQYFVSLVRENLHIVLCMSPIGAGFRNRCRMFPSLVNCCTIDWFNAWPEDALYSVAYRMFDEQKGLGIEPYVDKLSTMCNKLHRVVELETVQYFEEVKRYNYTTPTSYLELIKLYVEILKKQSLKISMNEKRYRVGLDKLKETEGIVADLEKRLTDMQPVLAQASIETNELLVQVSQDQTAADEQAAIVEVDVNEANIVASNVQIIKNDCQADLEEAMPAYESALKALATLDKKSVQEMKAFNNPPEMVKFTLEAVCILLDVKPDWGEAKRLLSQMDFMDVLKGYDKDNIPKRIIQKVKKYFDDPRFLPEKVEKQSSAAMCLCMWVRAMVVYDRVAKNIEPKKNALKEAEVQLESVMSQLKVKKSALQEVLDKVAGLQRTLRETQDKKANLELQAENAKKQLVRAGQLLGGLGGEKIRWQESASSLQLSLVNLVGDMCLAAGCLAYLGPFTAPYRARIVKQWMLICHELTIPCGANFSLITALAEPVVVRKWQIDGLPADDFSSENGLLTTLGRRWPLMIDPQGQANRWIRNTYLASNLQIIKLTEKDFLRTLENGIRYGAPVLLENVGQELDPGLEPVLLKQIFKRGGQNLLRLGDSDVPYSDEFRFLITTKLANPHYMPEICIKVTIINFTVTMKGLEDQLLVDVIKSERLDLEEKRDLLVVSIAADQKQLLEIEEEILSMLANASGNILDDEELINALARSKTTSSAINNRLAEAEVTTTEINNTREGYRVVASRGSIIYFVVANLSLIDPMYEYSLQYYKDLFVQRLVKTEKREVLEERLTLLINDITNSMYTNVCRGLFEKDKLLYSFVIAAQIEIAGGLVSEAEWQQFMIGLVVEKSVIEKYPLPDNLRKDISEKNWGNAVMLDTILPTIFGGLRDDVQTNVSFWTQFFITDSPHLDPLPAEWDTKLSKFQKLLLIRLLREEKVGFAVKHYVSNALGEYYTESPPFDLEGAFSDSTCVSPLIFILSPGADPTDYLLTLAQSKGKDGSGLRIISLGQGQGPIAEKALEAAQKSGDWVCLQNCHLAVSWLAKLEQLVEYMQNNPSVVNSEFRLWLTSMPSTSFPVPVLQNGIKVTNEPPRGLRANLMRTFLDIPADEYESCTKSDVFKKLIFATAFFNALILERRKFGAVGWNIPYEWMNSDLKTGMNQVKMYVEEQEDVPWETLNVQVADITYGGRVTDTWDKRAISSILRKYFVPEILNEDFRFTEDGVYFAPPPSDIATLRDYIRGLPTDDLPNVFGLHMNASITLQQKESRNLMETIVTCSGSGGGSSSGSDGSNDQKVMEVAMRITERLPQVFDLRKAHESTFKRSADAVNSLGVFLGQELIRFNGLIEVMKSTLRELVRAIKGEVVMSSELEKMYNCFVFHKVPSSWEEAGYPCLKPLPSWVEDFMLRITFMGDWLHEGPRLAYWLSGFFFPQGFMTAVKQTFSRDTAIAVDTLRIGCVMTAFEFQDIIEPPSSGAYVYGLFMEGGRFDRHILKMADSQSRQLFDQMPCVWLQPVITDTYAPQNVYNCPLYKTSLRAGTLSTTGHSTNFVVSLPIPTSLNEDHWIRRGCAMLCMLDE
jgi:dynein heavy chain, axonemal